MIRHQTAKLVNKDEFLTQLKAMWYPLIAKDADTETELTASTTRIKKSGFKKAFDIVGITDDDLRKVIDSIKAEKNA